MDELARAVAWWLDHPLRLFAYMLTLYVLCCALGPLAEVMVRSFLKAMEKR